MANEKQNHHKRRRPILGFLFTLVIPLIVVCLLVYFILMIAGVDTGAWIKDKVSGAPVISQFVSSNDEKEQANKLEKAKETNEQQKEEIEELTREIDSLEDIVGELEMEIKRLNNRTTDEADDGETDDNEVTENKGTTQDKEIKKIASSFRKMDPEKAAEIVENLEKDFAVNVLNHLSGDVRGKIFEAMKPKLAAELMKDMMP